MRSPLSVSNSAARWQVAAVPLCCASLVALAFAWLSWRHAAHRTELAGVGASMVAVFAARLAMALRHRIGGRLHRVRVDGEVLRVESRHGDREVAWSDVRDVRVRDVFPLEIVTLRLHDDSRIAFGLAHRNALTRLRSPMLGQLLARLPDASLRERAPRLGGDPATLPWWARCPELLAIPLLAGSGAIIATLCYAFAVLSPAVLDAPPWWGGALICAGGMALGVLAFLLMRSWRTPPDVRLWKGVLLVRCKRRGRWVERCHPLHGVAGVRYSRPFGRRRRVCLFAIELRGVLSTRALRITFPAQSSHAVLRTLRWPGVEEERS